MRASPVILSAACGLIVWKAAAFPDASIAGHDAIDGWIPAKRMIALNGLTAWNPHVHAGAPRIGDLTMGANPLLLLTFLSDTAWVNLGVAAHLLIGTFGMRAWARATGLDESPAVVAAMFYAMSSIWAGAQGLESVRGYDPLILRRYLTYYHAMFDGGPPNDIKTRPFAMARLRRRALLDLLAIRTVLTSEPVTGPGFTVSATLPHLVRNARALPRAFTVPESVIGDPFELAERIDPRLAVALREGIAARHEGSYTEATMLEKRPGFLDLRSDAEHPRFLVISEINHPGWKAVVDGRSVEILPAWEALMCLPLTAGDHRITLTYAPTSLLVGQWISLFAWIALAAAAWRR